METSSWNPLFVWSTFDRMVKKLCIIWRAEKLPFQYYNAIVSSSLLKKKCIFHYRGYKLANHTGYIYFSMKIICVNVRASPYESHRGLVDRRRR